MIISRHFATPKASTVAASWKHSQKGTMNASIRKEDDTISNLRQRKRHHHQ